MPKALIWSIVGCVAGPALCLCLLLLSLQATVASLPSQLDGYARALLTEAHAASLRLDGRTGEALAIARTSGENANTAVVRTERDANARVGQALELVDQRTGQVLEEIRGLRADAGPVLANAAALELQAVATLKTANDLTADAKDSLDDLYPDVKAAVESGTVAVTSVAQASDSFRGAVPKMLLTWQQIGANVGRTTDASARASEATAATMAHLSEATRPLPKWFRYSLGVAGTVAPTAVGIVGGMAAAGVFGR